VLRRVPGKVQGAVLGLAGLAGGGGASAWARRSTWTAAGKKCWARCQRPCFGYGWASAGECTSQQAGAIVVLGRVLG
jgi:hypothetical protein